MADLTIKQNDTWPPIEAVLSDAAGPVDLTGAAVKLILKSAGAGSTVITGACTIVDAVAGSVRYTWLAADTASVNTLNGEFEVTWGDGNVTTFPNDAYFSVEIKADLG